MKAVRGVTISISLVTDTKQTSQYSRAITLIRFYVSHHQTCQNMRPTVFLALCTDRKLGMMPETLEILQRIVPSKVIIVEHKINPQQPGTKHALPSLIMAMTLRLTAGCYQWCKQFWFRIGLCAKNFQTVYREKKKKKKSTVDTCKCDSSLILVSTLCHITHSFVL